MQLDSREALCMEYHVYTSINARTHKCLLLACKTAQKCVRSFAYSGTQNVRAYSVQRHFLCILRYLRVLQIIFQKH